MKQALTTSSLMAPQCNIRPTFPIINRLTPSLIALRGLSFITQGKALIFLAFLFLLLPSLLTSRPYYFGVSFSPLSEDEASEPRVQAYQIFLEQLSKKVGHEIKLAYFQNNEDLIKAIINNDVQIAYLRVQLYAKAKLTNKNLKRLLTVVTWNLDRTQKVTEYSSYFIARGDLNVSSVLELDDKQVGFTTNTASGFLYPVNYLRKRGIDYRTYFKRIYFYETEHKALAAIKNKDIDATPVGDRVYLANQYMGNFKVIGIIPNIPNPVIVASDKLAPSMLEDIKKALLSLPEEVFTGLNFIGFKETSDALYDQAIQMLQNTN